MSESSDIYELYAEFYRPEPQMIVDKDGTKHWTLNGVYHRDDGPAVVYANGTESWYKHGKAHREDGPAYIGVNGKKIWMKHDKIHRIDGPAVEDADGTKRWYIQGISYGKDFVSWATDALRYERIKPTEELIKQKVVQMMQQDLFD